MKKLHCFVSSLIVATLYFSEPIMAYPIDDLVSCSDTTKSKKNRLNASTDICTVPTQTAMTKYLSHLLENTAKDNKTMTIDDAKTFLSDVLQILCNDTNLQSINLSYPCNVAISDVTAQLYIDGKYKEVVNSLTNGIEGEIYRDDYNNIAITANTYESIFKYTRAFNQLIVETRQADSPKNCAGTDRSGNIERYGTLEHWLIQYDYIKRTSGAVREFQIPNSGLNGGTGYVDIAVPFTGELFEIKQNGVNGTIAGRTEVENYVLQANLNCTNSVVWKKGTNYTTQYLPSLRYPNSVLEASLTEAGVIQYKYIPKNNQPIPVSVPQNIADKIKSWVEETGKNINNVDKEILVFLQKNPDVANYIKIAAVGAAAVIIVGTIAEDFLTGGAGLWNDWQSFTIAYRLVRVAQLL